MLTGYNTDFKFQGKVYHCQTEDGGANSPFITSLLYFQGAILASRKTSYADILKADCLDEVVRELMMEQHKQMIRDLMGGKFNASNAPHEATYQSSTPPTEQPIAAAPVAPVLKETVVSPPSSPPAPKETPKEAPKEAPKEKPKEVPKEKPKEQPKPKEEPKQEPKEEPKEKSLDDIILELLAENHK